MVDFPNSLKNALTEYANQYSLADLKVAAQFVSETYRNSNRSSLPLVTRQTDVVAYALARMPATFAAVARVLENIAPCQTMIDVGAGTGSATWAALETGKAQSAICLEKEEKMRNLGSGLMKTDYPAVVWKPFDVKTDLLSDKADLVVSSYVLNELDQKSQLVVAEKLWQATENFLVIIEPGTPAGFEIISRIRTHLIQRSAFIVAPCPHSKDCPLAKDDWCHFTCRLARSQIHKLLKGGQAAYEDEKFSYLILSQKQPVKTFARILRHPDIEKGNIGLKLCTIDGLKSRTVSRKEKQLFKIARKASAGDEWNE
ncbi:MAG: rRNA methyltransferase [Alphaproteobacteria bacterium]|nr:rRNA methyltransferase [Alphaproteobacteria bacterium]